MSSATLPPLFRALAAGLATTIAGLLAVPLTTSAASPPGVEILAPRPGNSAVTAVQWYVNTYRQRVAAPAVVLEARLNQTAYTYASQMASRRVMSHTDASGGNAGTRISQTGYRWWVWGEDVAAGQVTVDQVMRAWYNSPGHRAVILDRRYIQMGIGRAMASDGTWYWCLLFASPG